jgi:hypothetical protein
MIMLQIEKHRKSIIVSIAQETGDNNNNDDFYYYFCRKAFVAAPVIAMEARPGFIYTRKFVAQKGNDVYFERPKSNKKK